MKLVEVMPITRTVLRDETFLYFTLKDVEAGALVSVPFRKKITPAIVVNITEVGKNKSALRRAPYPLKKIKSIISPRFLSREFLEVSKTLSSYYAAPQGIILKNLIPGRVLLKGNLDNRATDSKKTNFRYSKILCPSDWPDRAGYYKSIVREEFAHNASVFFCLPTASDAKTVFEEMRRGIEDYTLLIHGSLKAREFDDAWNKAVGNGHPLLIVGTGLILSLPRGDIGTIIIEREGSRHYKLKLRPFIDVRLAAEFLHKKLGSRFILGGDILRVETSFRKEEGEFEEAFPSSGRIRAEAEGAIASLEKVKEDSFVSEDLRDLIRKASANDEKILLFINRRGHSPTTICQDCGKTILCPRCNAPLVFHIDNEKNTRSMMCHHCFFTKNAYAECPYCKSWKLKLFGIGIQKAEEELKNFFPRINFIRFDADAVKNKKQGAVLIQKFLSKSETNQIVVGTELIFSYLTTPVDHIAVISVDALFTIPDFRINERVFSFLIHLRSLAAKTFLIQTRMPEEGLFKDVLKGDTTNFFRKEIEARRILNYPPFSKFIKITREEAKKDFLAKEISLVRERVKDYCPLDFPSFIGKMKNKYRWNILLRVEPEKWPEKYPELLSFLTNLGPQWRVEVDPESLL